MSGTEERGGREHPFRTRNEVKSENPFFRSFVWIALDNQNDKNERDKVHRCMDALQTNAELCVVRIFDLYYLTLKIFQNILPLLRPRKTHAAVWEHSCLKLARLYQSRCAFNLVLNAVKCTNFTISVHHCFPENNLQTVLQMEFVDRKYFT